MSVMVLGGGEGAGGKACDGLWGWRVVFVMAWLPAECVSVHVRKAEGEAGHGTMGCSEVGIRAGRQAGRFPAKKAGHGRHALCRQARH